MSSILTNNSAMNALSTLRGINKGLNQTQDRISSGLKIQSAKDNASYFAISKTMDSDSGMNKAINESLTLTKNAVSAGRTGAEAVMEMTKELGTKVAFAKNQLETDASYDTSKVQSEIDAIVSRIGTVIEQASFNGTSMVNGTGNAHTSDGRYIAASDTSAGGYTAAADPDNIKLATGVTRSGSTLSTTSITIEKVDLVSIKDALSRIKLGTEPTAQVRDGTKQITTAGASYIKGQVAYGQLADDENAGVPVTDGAGATNRMDFYLDVVDKATTMAIDAATSLGVSEKSIETQQDFLTKLTDKLDSGIGSMVDADMEEEAARLQALQVQQQLASQSLSIANQAPQQILSLFR
ncbi:flagellin N-terminal helical domain-containing protein [Limimaricola variabilis]